MPHRQDLAVQEHSLASAILPKVAFQRMVSCDVDCCSVEDVFDTFFEHNLRALPVYEEIEPGTRKWGGVATILDLVSYTIKEFSNNKNQNNNNNNNNSNKNSSGGGGKNAEAMDVPSNISYSSPQQFLNQPLRHALGHSKESTSVPILLADTPIDVLFQLFSNGYHYVLVAPSEYDDDNNDSAMADPSSIITVNGNEEPRIISQFDLLLWIRKILRGKENNNDTLSAFTSSTVGAVMQQGAKKATISMQASETALEGFKRMFYNKITSIVVNEDQGEFCAILSASDLRGLTHQRLNSLHEPVQMFLQHVCGIPRDPVSLTSKSPLLDAIDLMIQNQVHQVIVTGENKPKVCVGICSMSDVCWAFCNLALQQKSDISSLLNVKSILTIKPEIPSISVNSNTPSPMFPSSGVHPSAFHNFQYRHLKCKNGQRSSPEYLMVSENRNFMSGSPIEHGL